MLTSDYNGHCFGLHLIQRRGLLFFLLALFYMTFLPAHEHQHGTSSALQTMGFWSSCKEVKNKPLYNPYAHIALKNDYFPAIVFDAGNFSGHGDPTSYKMWHEGVDGIALSYSSDGIHWHLYGELNIQGTHPCVVYDENGFENGTYYYKMWLWTGAPARGAAVIQYSQSLDGITWMPAKPIIQDINSPLVFGEEGTSFYLLQGPGSIIYSPSTAPPTEGKPSTFPYLMFYDTSSKLSPNAETIGLAYSSDGIRWKRHGERPVLLPHSSSEAWDGTNVFRPSIIKIDNTYQMFYSGANSAIKDASQGHGIGHASSKDGVRWRRNPNNPIFLYSDGVKWRDARIHAPVVLFDDFSNSNDSKVPYNPPPYLKMWFSAGRGTTAGRAQGIGYATWPLAPIPNHFPPPTNFIGVVRKDEFLNASKFLLSTKWHDPLYGSVISYRIYYGEKIAVEIPATHRSVYKKTITYKDSAKKYSIAAVYPDNKISKKIQLRILYE